MSNPWERERDALAPAQTRARADALRRRPTEAERRLWWHLRHRLGVTGTHFRRQVAIGPFVVDFGCLAAQLVVEVDGEQHGFDRHRAQDAERTRELEARGFRVIRFSNREVLTAMDVVRDSVLAAMAPAAPSPLARESAGTAP